MRAFLTVFRVTLAGKALVPVTALMAGATPVVLGLVRPEIYDKGPGIQTLIWLLILGACFLLGLPLLGDDLAGGRMSFFFGRPVPAAAIWAGKLAGGIVLALAIEAAALAPMLLAWPRWAQGADLDGFGLSSIVVPILAVAVGAVSGVILRGRSRWSIVDAFIVVWTPFFWMDVAHREPVFQIFILAVIVAALAASGAAVAVGRISPRRAHAAASVTLWSILLPVAGVATVYVHWFLPA